MTADRWPALTVRQPWAWALAYGGKPVENRGREVKYRGPLWLHAGARSRWDPAGAESPLVLAAWPVPPAGPADTPRERGLHRATPLMAFGAVIALLEVTGCHQTADCQEYPPGLVRDGLPAPALCSPWAVSGQWHIGVALRQVLAEPVPCRGALGLWRLPEDTESAVRAQLAGG